MKNKVTVSIAGQEYTLVGTEDESYVRKIASHVDAQVREVSGGSRMSLVDGAILAAMNIADKYFKAQQSSDNMRAQIKSYAEECAQLRSEIIKLKKQNKEG